MKLLRELKYNWKIMALAFLLLLGAWGAAKVFVFTPVLTYCTYTRPNSNGPSYAPDQEIFTVDKVSDCFLDPDDKVNGWSSAEASTGHPYSQLVASIIILIAALFGAWVIKDLHPFIPMAARSQAHEARRQAMQSKYQSWLLRHDPPLDPLDPGEWIEGPIAGQPLKSIQPPATEQDFLDMLNTKSSERTEQYPESFAPPVTSMYVNAHGTIQVAPDGRWRYVYSGFQFEEFRSEEVYEEQSDNDWWVKNREEWCRVYEAEVKAKVQGFTGRPWVPNLLIAVGVLRALVFQVRDCYWVGPRYGGHVGDTLMFPWQRCHFGHSRVDATMTALQSLILIGLGIAMIRSRTHKNQS